LISAAVEEILRYDGSVQMRGVSVGEDIEFEANQIRAGQTLWLAIGATGRDPRQFANPSCFDIARSPNRHLQFGVGPHFCIGAALARAEIQLALTGLLGRFRRIELAADDIKWHQIAVFRGPKAVPLALGLAPHLPSTAVPRSIRKAMPSSSPSPVHVMPSQPQSPLSARSPNIRGRTKLRSLSGWVFIRARPTPRNTATSGSRSIERP